ncbi:sensor histidine kinase [Microtetraspora malaysiensis]|uniref:sensor histidine kinase n=1 Tax=Microtetraspora malaysiensis TaxID=161358 RepID=UPI00082DFAD3|nr:histidine kinase [Microtetraspora malaysiensis]
MTYWIRLRSRHRVALDVAGAALTCAIMLLIGQGNLLSQAVGAVVALVTIARRRRPVGVLVVVTAGTLALLVSGTLSGYPPIPMVLAMHTMTVTRDRRQAAALAGTVTVVLLVAGVAVRQPVSELTRDIELVVPGLLTGELARARQAYLAGLATLERQRTRALLTAERMRIARELHDVVAHGLSVMTMQAGAALHTPQHEAVLRETLGSIEMTGRAAMTEVRRLLQVLREEPDGTAAAPELAPMPGLAGLGSLIARTAQAGVEVELRTHGHPRPLPAGADLVAYRVVQEALTNIIKHTGTGSGTVLVGYEPDAVLLDITNPPPPPGRTLRIPPADGGHGLTGMRERVALYGGSLRAGPLPGGGYAVTAHLPIPAKAVS